MSALIDTHLHLLRHEFDGDREAVLRRAHDAGVRAFLHVGYDHETIPQAIALAEELPASWASAGIHPHDASSWDAATAELLRRLAGEGRIVAIGECGLDFFRDLSPRDVQRRALCEQIALAEELRLPLVFHVRDAYDDMRELLLAEGLPSRRGVFHAFAGDREFAHWAVEAGFLLGIGGPLSYKKGQLADSIRGLPATAFVLETDAPWLPPQPWRGKRNEPAYMHFTGRTLARVLELDFDQLAVQLASNFERLFDVKLPADLHELEPSHCSDPAEK